MSFEVEPGECLLVVGPSGSGKSTLALAVAGLVPHEFAGEWAGRLSVGSLDTLAASRPLLARDVGLVFQDPESQLVMDRVEDDVAFGLENRGWPIAAMRTRVGEALVEVGLAGFERRRSIRLSGGEQQRLALAGVLAPRPRVLVLDEPTANLDPAGTTAFFDRLRGIRARRAATIVLVEHRVDLAWPIADRVLALGRDGRPIDCGSPEDVLARSSVRLAREGVWLPERPIADTERSSHHPRVPEGQPDRPPEQAGTAGRSGPSLAVAAGVSFGYDRSRLAVDSASIRIEAGERVALVGPNGSGKSSLGRLLVGLLRPDSGRVRLGGDDPSRLPAHELARRAGYVFQDPEQQFLAARVADEVMLGLDPGERATGGRLMEVLGLPLPAFGERSPYTLSGGEQRRLSIACALVRSPRFLVLDEPTFGQDRRGYEGLLGLLRDRVDAGTAVLAATHDTRFVRDFAARVVRIEAGRIRDGDAEDGAAA
ncbi:MAG TPA: ATP-binding cassette domain-containing protein [Candidatus Limnocylindrales bacterium]